MAWYDCTAELSTAVLTLLAADAVLGTAGTGGIAVRELLPAITDDDPVLHKKIVPYIGVACQLGHPRNEGWSRACPLTVRLHVANKETPPSTARAFVSAISLLATNLVENLSGSVPSGMSNQITHVDSVISDARVDKNDNTLVRQDSSVTFDLWYHV